MAWYVAQIGNDGGRQTVRFPDAPVICVSADTIEEAVERASQALAWHLESMRAKGIVVRSATPLTAFDDEPRAAGAVYALVEIEDAVDAA